LDTPRSYSYFNDLTGLLPDIPPDSIVSRTFYEDSQFKAILFGFAQGQELSEHTASKPAILHFLQGEARLTLGGDDMQVRQGAWVHMPANLAHSIYAQTPLHMLLLLLENTPA
jgi:quercetin dioxygenase-like cupin family protein